MNHLAALLTPDTILLDLAFTSKQDLFEHAGSMFSRLYNLKPTDVINSLSEREQLGSTALGYGIAIPHGRIKALREATGALYRLEHGMEFDAPDGKPVVLCFILLVPNDANEAHLQILGELAQLFGDEAMRSRLLQSKDTAELNALINTWTA